MPEIGPRRQQQVNEFIMIKEEEKTKSAVMVHVNTGLVMKIWAAVEGMEEAAWQCMLAYAKRVSEFNGIDWDTDDVNFVYPVTSEDFISEYMDPVGFGVKTSAEMSAKLMEKILRRFNQ